MPLPVKSSAEAIELVRGYAEATAGLLDSELTDYDASPAACRGRGGEIATDGRFDVSGHAQIRVPEDTHIAALQRVRDAWAAAGYEITSHRTFTGGTRGEVAARNPTDGVQISLESTRPPIGFALLILTPCYQPPESP